MRLARNARPPSSQSHPDPLMNGYCFPTTTFEMENQEEAAANNERTIASERTSLAVILLVDRDRSGGGGGGQGIEPASEPDRQSGFRVQYIAVFIASGDGEGDRAVQCSSDRVTDGFSPWGSWWLVCNRGDRRS